MTLPKCTHWLGHKFEGRYSTKPARHISTEQIFWIGSVSAEKLIKNNVIRAYERDVCIRCGVTVEKKSAATSRSSGAAAASAAPAHKAEH